MKSVRRMRIELIRPMVRGLWPMEPELVTAYRRMLREGKKPPPVKLGHRLAGGRWQLVDGRHRLKAAKLEGAKTIKVRHLIIYG